MARRRPRPELEQTSLDGGDPSAERLLPELCTDFFLLGLQIAAGQLELPACETLKRRVLQLLEGFKKRPEQASVPTPDIDDARYALAAYLDEVIQYSDWPGKQEWAARPLQAQLFGESRAGARFFDRLREVRRRSSPALEIYYDCLVLGFMGEYRLGNPQEIEELIGDLRRELCHGVGKTISVHGSRPEAMSLGGKSLPLMPIAGMCLLLAVVGLVILYLTLSSSHGEAAQLLEQIGAR